MMKKIGHIAVSGIVSLAISCQATAPASSLSEGVDLRGERFRCNDPNWVTICLRVLHESCSLSIAPGRGLPREPDDKLVLIRGRQARVVAGPEDLAGCVEIRSEQDALEYLRFFSSYETVYLFAEKDLEVYKGKCLAVCLPDERWKTLGLAEAAVSPREDGYEVTRYVIKPTVNIPEVQLLRVVQRVKSDGVVTTLSSQLVPLPLEDRLRLSFPRFL